MLSYKYGITVTIVATQDDKVDDNVCISHEETPEPCIKVTAKHDPVCISITGDTPYISITPTTTEVSEPPALHIQTVQNITPLLGKNIDDNGLVYVKKFDTILVVDATYVNGDTYNTMEVNTDLENGAIFDNGNGTFIWSVGSIEDGIDLKFRIKKVSLSKTSSEFAYAHAVSMMQSDRVWYNTNNTTEKGFIAYSQILYYDPNNEYHIEYMNISYHTEIEEDRLVPLDKETGIFGLSTAFMALAFIGIEVTMTEPFRYKSEITGDNFMIVNTELPLDFSEKEVITKYLYNYTGSSYGTQTHRGEYPDGTLWWYTEITATTSPFKYCSTMEEPPHDHYDFPLFVYPTFAQINGIGKPMALNRIFSGVCDEWDEIITNDNYPEKYIVRHHKIYYGEYDPSLEAFSYAMYRNDKFSSYYDRVVYY